MMSSGLRPLVPGDVLVLVLAPGLVYDLVYDHPLLVRAFPAIASKAKTRSREEAHLLVAQLP
jgi:hypothetical protein